MHTPLPNHTTATGPADFEPGAGLTPQQWWEVVAPPTELAARCAELLPRDGVLDADELERFAGRVAQSHELWEPLVVEDRERRRYRLLYEDANIDVWVLCWMDGQATGFHDHVLSAVGLACASGQVVERQMLLPTGATSIELGPGDTRRGPSSYIHAVAHVEGAPAVTIHAYSPPLEWVGQYRVDHAGVMRRDVMHGRQELLDHSIATLDPARA